jgi:hypothetical protein
MPLSEHDAVMQKHQGILHVLPQFGDKMYIPKEFSENTFVKIHAFERLPVIHIARGNYKSQQLTLIVDYQVEFKP